MSQGRWSASSERFPLNATAQRPTIAVPGTQEAEEAVEAERIRTRRLEEGLHWMCQPGCEPSATPTALLGSVGIPSQAQRITICAWIICPMAAKLGISRITILTNMDRRLLRVRLFQVKPTIGTFTGRIPVGSARLHTETSPATEEQMLPTSTNRTNGKARFVFLSRSLESVDDGIGSKCGANRFSAGDAKIGRRGVLTDFGILAAGGGAIRLGQALWPHF
jgi:hypothetical protein